MLSKKKNGGTLHNLAKELVPLFAASRSVICRYLPLIQFHLPLFAAINCGYLLLFTANGN
jgi:hypothetical protein